jgi:hypothetical protein
MTLSLAAGDWQWAVQKLAQLHSLVFSYEHHLRDKRLPQLQAVVNSIEALNSKLSAKLHRLASFRCFNDAACEQIVCELRVSQGSQLGAGFLGDGKRGGGAVLKGQRSACTAPMQLQPRGGSCAP